VQLQAAAFFFNRDKKVAEQLLRRIVDEDPSERNAARLLAILLAPEATDEHGLDEVLQLLSGDNAEPTDKRVKAFLLYNQGHAGDREAAMKLFQELVDDPAQVAAIDRLLLARLYETQGRQEDMAAAREQLKILANVEKPEPDHLAAYIDNLLRSERSADARAPLESLAEMEPADANFRTLSLKSRWLAGEGRSDEVGPLIAAYVAAQHLAQPEDASHAKTLVAVGDLLASLRLNEGAERSYRQAFALAPSAHLSLAIWLSKQDRTSEAVEVCLQAAERDSGSLPAIVMTNVLTVGSPSDADLNRAEPMLEAAFKRHADDPTLLFSTGTRHLMKGEKDEAVGLFRQVLKLRPKEAQAMNNLAFALSLKPDGLDEAIEWLDKAIGIAGRNPELLDSKGWVLFLKGDVPEAVGALKDALLNLPGDPRHRFHLALAYRAQGKAQEAAAELKRAQQEGLDVDLLSPVERAELTKLEAALAAGNSSHR
jgi:Flp pilus assembly protein TadD